MRVAHKIDLIILSALLLMLLLLPRSGYGETLQFGDYIVRYSAVTTNVLPAQIAQSYGLQRSSRNGLLNIAVQKKQIGDEAALIGATLHGSVSDLTGHAHPITFRETREGGDIDYLGEFPLDGSGTYLFTVSVAPAGAAQAYTLKFNQNYVVD